MYPRPFSDRRSQLRPDIALGVEDTHHRLLMNHFVIGVVVVTGQHEDACRPILPEFRNNTVLDTREPRHHVRRVGDGIRRDASLPAVEPRIGIVIPPEVLDPEESKTGARLLAAPRHHIRRRDVGGVAHTPVGDDSDPDGYPRPSGGGEEQPAGQGRVIVRRRNDEPPFVGGPVGKDRRQLAVNQSAVTQAPDVMR
jgi:hypothetical protein